MKLPELVEALCVRVSFCGSAALLACSLMCLSFILVAMGTVPPRITGLNSEQVTAILNSSISLPCDVHAHPSPEVAWYKDGQALSLGEGVFFLPGR